jgi:CysZ protein
MSSTSAIKNAFGSFGESYKLILKDKASLTLAAIPIIIGMTLYYFIGISLFHTVTEFGNNYIQDYLGDGTLGQVVNWIVKIILTILLYYIVNLTFILIVSIIASPFNDVLSARIEKQILKQDLPSFGASFSTAMKRMAATIITEIKKIIVILGVSVLVIFMGFFPFLTPVSIVLGAMVLSVEFIDFSWSRHGLSFKECKSEFKSHILGYTIGGLFFMLLISIPIVNLVVPCLATSYFTILWVKNNESSGEITK